MTCLHERLSATCANAQPRICIAIRAWTCRPETPRARAFPAEVEREKRRPGYCGFRRISAERREKDATRCSDAETQERGQAQRVTCREPRITGEGYSQVVLLCSVFLVFFCSPRLSSHSLVASGSHIVSQSSERNVISSRGGIERTSLCIRFSSVSSEAALKVLRQKHLCLMLENSLEKTAKNTMTHP